MCQIKLANHHLPNKNFTTKFPGQCVSIKFLQFNMVYMWGCKTKKSKCGKQYFTIL